MKLLAPAAVALVAATSAGAAYKPSALLRFDGAYRLADRSGPPTSSSSRCAATSPFAPAS